VANKRVQTEMWAIDLPLWAYVLVGFCPMGFCPMGFCPMGFCPTLGEDSVSVLYCIYCILL